MQGATGRPVPHSGSSAPVWGRRRLWHVLIPPSGRRLVLVALATALLLGALSVTLAVRRYDGQRARVRADALADARAAAAAIDRQLQDRVLLLQTLALSPMAHEADSPALNAYFTDVRTAEMALTDLYFADTRGAIIATSATSRATAPASFADRAYFRAVVETSRPAISEALTGRLSGRRIVAVAVPVHDRGGALIGVLTAGIPTESLAQNLQAQPGDRHSVLRVVDATGQLVAESRPTDAAVHGLSGPLSTAPPDAGDGVWFGVTGLDGSAGRMTAFTPIASTGWRLVIEEPEAAALGDARRELAATLTMLGLLLLAGTGGVMIAGRRLERATVAQRSALLEAQAENAERQRAETALRHSEQRFRSLVQNASDMVAVLDPGGTLLSVSPSVERMLGYQAEDWVGRSLVELIHLEDQAAVARAFAAAGRRAGHHPPIRFRLRHARGAWRWLEARTTNLFDDPAVQGMVVNVRDVTDRQRNEQTARFFDEAGTALAGTLDYQDVLDRVARLAVPFLADWCSVDVLQEDGSIRRVVVATSTAEQEQALRELRARFPHNPEAPAGVPSVLRTGEPELIAEVTDSFLAANCSGPEHLEALRALKMRSILRVPLGEGERPADVLSLILADSGRRYNAMSLRLARGLARRAALALEHAGLYREAQQALALRDEFFSSISHDLRTPLTAIKANAQMLRRRLARGADLAIDRAAAVETLAAIDEASVRMTGMISELLDLARLQSGRPLELETGPADLAAMLRQEAAWLQSATNRHTIEVEAPERLVVEADAPRLERVVANLLSNAIKYSPAGGTVRATLGEVTAEDGRAAVQLQVTDQGIGIPATDLPHIFERFRRGANAAGISGSGIGLASARQIVGQHGGDITIASRQDEGTTVTVRLPALAADREPEAGAPSPLTGLPPC